VRNELSSWLVLAHLALAMIILGFLVAAAVMAMPTSSGVADPGYRRLAAIAAGASYLLLLTGSTVVASGAEKSCQSWPLCGSGFTPDFSGSSAFTMLHRGSVLLIGAMLVFVLLRGIRFPELKAVSTAAVAVFALQVAVGAGAALTDGALFNGLHVALGTLVWAGVLTTALLTLPRADRDRPLSRLAVERRSA
jgi:protoheme IX farnesyltransferase